MKADSLSGFHYKRSKNTSSKVLGMHRQVDTKTLNKLFSDSWPTDYNNKDSVWIMYDIGLDVSFRPIITVIAS